MYNPVVTYLNKRHPERFGLRTSRLFSMAKDSLVYVQTEVCSNLLTSALPIYSNHAT